MNLLDQTDEKLTFLEDEPERSTEERLPWRMLIVDDEPEVHEVTRYALGDFRFDGRGLEFVHAYSAGEARELLAASDNIVIILLDVVMETDDAGLDLVEFVRNTMDNQFMRIILRTGQPGQAPEKEVISAYHINDYKNKAELTELKLYTSVLSSLRSWSDMMTIESFRSSLEAKVDERTAELRLKNVQLTELNREKNEFLGIAAHDLKNPLSVIQGFADMIATERESLSPEAVSEFAEVISGSTRRMFDLIKNLLDVNTIESGKLTVIHNEFRLGSLVEEVVEDFRRTASAKGIVLEYSNGGMAARVTADRDLTRQIVENLVSNAIKYSPPGRCVEIAVRTEKTMGYCRVTDSGPGLSDDDKKRLYRKFARLSARPTGDEHSNGLGLFIVKKLIDRMHGRVWCESETGHGATFSIGLPSPDN